MDLPLSIDSGMMISWTTVSGSVISWTLYLLVIAGLGGHVLLNKRDPRAAAMWLLLVVFVPALGAVLYVLIGVERIRRKLLRKEASNLSIRQAWLARPVQQQRQPLLSSHPSPAALHRTGPPRHRTATASGRSQVLQVLELPASSPSASFFSVIDRLSARPLMAGNRIQPMSQGDRVYQRMLQAIERATHHIHLETYIFGSDRVGLQLVELMMQRAAEGIEVRLLYDTVGSIDALPFLEELRFSKVRAVAFSPLNPLKRRFQINLRNHRKLLVVDGRTAFTGGMNINEKHLVDHPLLTRVRDYHFQVEGPVVSQMQEWFVEDWFYASGEQLLADPYFPLLEARGGMSARVITSGPDGDYEVLYYALLAAIHGAQARIFMVTPYFIPDAGLMSALLLARARGIEVCLVVPGYSDHPFVQAASRAWYLPLLQAGVLIYERNAPFLHAKLTLVDQSWVLIGSANVDVRSFRLNFEANLEVRDDAFAEVILKRIRQEMQASTLVSLEAHQRRPLRRKLFDAGCALFSPML